MLRKMPNHTSVSLLGTAFDEWPRYFAFLSCPQITSPVKHSSPKMASSFYHQIWPYLYTTGSRLFFGSKVTQNDTVKGSLLPLSDRFIHTMLMQLYLYQGLQLAVVKQVQTHDIAGHVSGVYSTQRIGYPLSFLSN